jgi:hypothetical protein
MSTISTVNQYSAWFLARAIIHKKEVKGI